MNERPCNECIWHSEDGCWRWDCEPVTRQEAKKRLRGETVWISVDDRLPEIKHRQTMMDNIGGVELIWYESDPVLVYMPEARQKVDIGWMEREYGDDARWLTCGDYCRENVTHWMPLPAPPKEASE